MCVCLGHEARRNDVATFVDPLGMDRELKWSVGMVRMVYLCVAPVVVY